MRLNSVQLLGNKDSRNDVCSFLTINNAIFTPIVNGNHTDEVNITGLKAAK